MKTIILTTLLVVGFFAQANQEEATTSALEFTREEAASAPRGLLPFIGLGGGYTGYDTDGDVEGTPATLKLLGSYYFDNPTVIDVGYGINYQNYTQLDDSDTDGALEIAARYRWANRWQAGVVANQFFDQGPNYTADQADAQFVGLQVLRDFNLSPAWLARLGARAMALTNNTDGQVYQYLIDLQIGWNPQAYRTTVASENPVAEEEEVVAVEEFTEVEPARPVAETAPGSALQEVNYGMIAGTSANIQFQTAKSNISSQDQQKISRVAQALSENPDLVERVEIHGYADSTGSADFNQQLSQQRAESVASILEKNGVNNVVAVGKGTSDTTGMASGDRRAELVFVGVKDEEKLREVLSEIE
ncbi:OmpA family protein [Bdellovibrio sp. 22V]|uniref:OmpA family protein n=1 Tax=Bdellovibrio TaxID=958 RepID=UPI002543E819|nr:OmpA family protein [Bdellovibrio sp. 22V]WII71372.1 OmpA family protein [Bdellovibrio sp. 22V]